MTGMRVRHLGGDRFAIDVRDHVVLVDQLVADGGEDTAPTPTELFIAGIASCIAFYAMRYLVRHNLPTDGLDVTATYTLAKHPARVADIGIEITVPDGIPDENREPLLAMASHCTLHNTLKDPPAVSIALAPSGVAAR